jgi:hypothetical protein
MKGIICENAKDLARKLHGVLNTKHKRYTLRPFNRFDSERSMWWVIPSTVYPAYKFGKYIIYENKDGTFSVGVHIEKGLEKSLDDKKVLMMDHTWVWHEFIEAVKSGQIEDILLTIHKKMKDTVQISVLVDIPASNKQLNYQLQDGQFINQYTQEAGDIKLVPDWINNFLQIEWFWVDFYIVFTFRKLNGQSTEEELTEYEIERDLLKPLECWIK